MTAKRVFLIGATGTIGRPTATALVAAGHDVTCFVRSENTQIAGAALRIGDVTDAQSLTEHGFQGESFDAVISCLASRSGTPQDAWAIDHAAHMQVLQAAQAVGADHFVLLSAICVQKPLLDFQQAKLAFETALQASGLRYSIVRPTAFFKSLSGQVKRVQDGKPFLIFGDGTLTACKPISDRDLGQYLTRCLSDPALWNTVLPIGGPGPAITLRDQGNYLFEKLGKPAKFRSVSPKLISTRALVLATLGRIAPPLATKAALARIGHYYATESMLVLNPETGTYDADATPEFGQDTLFDYYDRLLAGTESAERGDHAVF